MTSFTNQVQIKVLRIVVHALFKVFYNCLRYDGRRSLKEFDEESGYGSDGQEKSLIARGEYRIACDGARGLEGEPRELPIAAIAKSLDRYVEYLLQKTRGNGQGYFQFTYRVGFSDLISCFLGGSWQSLTRIEGACEVLTRDWSNGKVDLKFMESMCKNRSPVYEEMLFTVKIRLYVRESSLIAALLSTRVLLARNRPQFGSENNPRAITKKSEFAVQSQRKLSTGSKYPSNTDILAANSFFLKSKALCIEWNESKGVNYPHGASFKNDFARRFLQTSSSDELPVKEKGNEKVFWGSSFPVEASNAPLTPPATPTSEDSLSPSSSPTLSPEVNTLDYNYWKGEDPLCHVREILQKNLPADRTVKDTNGSPQSSLKVPIIELTPPDSPERKDSRSPSLSPPPESLKDFYSNDGHPLLASRNQFSSVLKHFGHGFFEYLAQEQDYCPYATDFLKTQNEYSPANEWRASDEFEQGLTGRPEGKSKLFGTWTNLTQDTCSSAFVDTSSAFVDKFQYGFFANENCLKMVDDLLREKISVGRQN